jgi:hypothetical protein
MSYTQSYPQTNKDIDPIAVPPVDKSERVFRDPDIHLATKY